MEDGRYYSPLTRQQYEQSRSRRLYPDAIEEKNWYTARHLSNPAEDIGHYALEFLIEIVEVRPDGDAYSLQMNILDEDGRTVEQGDNLFSRHGLFFDPDFPFYGGLFA
jgi:hypothetical protein